MEHVPGQKFRLAIGNTTRHRQDPPWHVVGIFWIATGPEMPTKISVSTQVCYDLLQDFLISIGVAGQEGVSLSSAEAEFYGLGLGDCDASLQDRF